jgi:molybdopterin-guanine dinucleotide biosynthesis adapter protein
MSAPRFLAVVGGKHSGKTTTIENLILELRRRGYRVGTVKEMVRISSLDTPGKETDRYTVAGAETVVAVPRDETVVFIKRKLTLWEIAPFLANLDFVLLEGFETETTIPRVIAAKNVKEVQTFSQGQVVAVSGLLAESAEGGLKLDKPLLNCRLQGRELAELVVQKAIPLNAGPIRL